MRNFDLPQLDLSVNPMLELLAKDPTIQAALVNHSDTTLFVKAKHRLAAVFIQAIEHSRIEVHRGKRKKVRRNLTQFIDDLLEKNYNQLIENHELFSCINFENTCLSYENLPDFMKTIFPEKVKVVEPYVPSLDFLSELVSSGKAKAIDVELLERIADDAGVDIRDLVVKCIPVLDKYKAFLECGEYDKTLEALLKEYADHIGESVDDIDYNEEFFDDLDDVVDHDLVTFVNYTFSRDRSIGVNREVELVFTIEHVEDLCDAVGTLIKYIIQKEDLYKAYLELKSKFEPDLQAGDENYALEA